MNKQKMKRFFGNFTFNYQKKLEREVSEMVGQLVQIGMLFHQ